MVDAAQEDRWAPHADEFVDHYGSLRGRVRTHVIHEHLRAHLPPAPERVVDVGGGAGHQSIPLAREGYDVTIVDPSSAMRERAERRIAGEESDAASRVTLVQASGEEASSVLRGRPFGAVLCHGVLMYIDEPEALVDVLCQLSDHDGIVSIVTKNVATLAVRPALEGDWLTAQQAFD